MDLQSNISRIYALQSINRLSYSPLQQVEQLHTSCSWMIIGTAGVGAVIMEPHRYTLSSGSAVMGDPGTLMLHVETSDEEWKAFFIEFLPLQILNNAQECCGVEVKEAHVSIIQEMHHASELGSLAERLFSETRMNTESPQNSLRTHILLQQMMLCWLNEDDDKRVRPRVKNQEVQSTLRYMEKHYREMLTREELAEKTGIVSAYFSVLFKKMVGISPFAYLERIRIHRAAELLLQERKNNGDLAEIALRSGFRDPWYMSKRFRKIQGMSPSAYRNSYVPERVASLKYPYTNHLIKLGIIPSAARFNSPNDMIASTREPVVELPALLSIESLNQVLMDNQPQVIITYDSEDVMERLRWVAPVIHIPWLLLSWREHMMTIGRLLQREAEAVRCIEELDRKAADVKKQVYVKVAPGTRISVFKIESQRCYLYGVRDTGCIFYEFLSYSPHPYIQEQIARDSNFHSVEISIRQMAEFAGDWNFVILYPDGNEQHDFLRINEHWRTFELETPRPIVYLDYREWLHYDPINISAQLDKIIPILLEQEEQLTI